MLVVLDSRNCQRVRDIAGIYAVIAWQRATFGHHEVDSENAGNGVVNHDGIICF